MEAEGAYAKASATACEGCFNKRQWFQIGFNFNIQLFLILQFMQIFEIGLEIVDMLKIIDTEHSN